MEKDSESCQDRLLDQCSEASDDGFYQKQKHHQQTLLSRVVKYAFQATTVSLLLYIAIVITFPFSSKRASPAHEPAEHFTLADESLQFEQRSEWVQRQSPWTQPPSDELDLIWEELLYPINVRVTSDELDILHENKTNRVHVTGNDRTDYLGVVGVYHQLHCLNNIRQLLSWDYYGPKVGDRKHGEGFAEEHTTHCLDAIRQTLMCHANTAVYTSEWEWESGTRRPSKHVKTAHLSTCVQWDSLDSWARQRVLVPGEYKFLSDHAT